MKEMNYLSMVLILDLLLVVYSNCINRTLEEIIQLPCTMVSAFIAKVMGSVAFNSNLAL